MKKEKLVNHSSHALRCGQNAVLMTLQKLFAIQFFVNNEEFQWWKTKQTKLNNQQVHLSLLFDDGFSFSISKCVQCSVFSVYVYLSTWHLSVYFLLILRHFLIFITSWTKMICFRIALQFRIIFSIFNSQSINWCEKNTFISMKMLNRNH